jgi:hypothetical protein
MQAGAEETESNPWKQERTVTVPVFVWYWYEGRREAADTGFRALAPRNGESNACEEAAMLCALVEWVATGFCWYKPAVSG